MYQQPEQSFPSFDRTYLPHQPDANDVFTFSAADFPQVPDMTQPQLQYHDPVNRYYPYTDFKLDDLLGDPVSAENFTNTEDLQQLNGQSMGKARASLRGAFLQHALRCHGCGVSGAACRRRMAYGRSLAREHGFCG